MRLSIIPLAAAFVFSSAFAAPSNPSIGSDPFTGSFRMEMHLYKGAKEEKHSPVNMLVWSKPDMVLYESTMPDQPKHMRMLADLRGNFLYTLMDDGKGGKTAMKMPRPDASAVAKEDEGEQPTITVTQETKVISGHTCTKVIATAKEGTWTGWVAKDLGNAFEHLAKGMSGPAARQQRHARTDISGFPLEFEWVSVKGDERVVCHIRDLVVGKVDEALFDISAYQVMQMPSFSMPQR